jgi:hypothetical protein
VAIILKRRWRWQPCAVAHFIKGSAKATASHCSALGGSRGAGGTGQGVGGGGREREREEAAAEESGYRH